MPRSRGYYVPLHENPHVRRFAGGRAERHPGRQSDYELEPDGQAPHYVYARSGARFRSRQLKTAISRIETELRSDERIDPETIQVKFNSFQESSLGLYFYFFTKTTVWSEHLQTRQDENFSILRILEEEGVQLAYPAQHVFLQTAEVREKPLQPV